MRARVVAALRTLDLTDVPRLRPLPDDPAPGVVRETVLALLPSAGLLPAEWPAGRLAPDRPPHLRRAVFRLLDARGGIVRLRAAVGLLDDPDARLRGRAEESVRRWTPSADLPRGDAEAAALLRRARHLFTESGLRLRLWQTGAADR
ncbi:hypothetical protein GCM10010129_82530 [Streptomyces fumigatiscleroticus]|nr:hypothetical protein GCM10010129_82530 [Streptomyces fumigatiscleroticus]